ncbi:MAG: hypothetical protein JXQ93_01075 [Flavobacteriaceae bacterium]
MKTKYLIGLLLAFGILFVSCKEEASLKEYMTDSWQTTYLKIEMPTYQKSDSISIYEDIFEGSPPERRAQSSYKSDGTFIAWSLDKKGKRFGDSPGKWNIKGDSLHIEYFYGGRDVKVAYYIEKTAEGFKGTSKYDWDEDGANDDLLIMKTKRIYLNE